MPMHEFTLRGWAFTSEKNPISNAQELDEALAWLEDRARTTPIPPLHALPEMYFGSNHLTVRGPGGVTISFDPREALARVEVGPQGLRWRQIKVKAADAWQRRMDQQREMRRADSAVDEPTPTASASTCPFDIRPEEIQETPKPFDWTYSTDFRGSVSNADVSTTVEEIPLAKLAVREPILYFDENVMFEDELGDNGVSKYSVKIRVMPSGFFILARQFLRVDHVQYAFYDTRIYHAFGSDHVLREYLAQSIDYDTVLVRATREAGPPVSVTAAPVRPMATIPTARMPMRPTMLAAVTAVAPATAAAPSGPLNATTGDWPALDPAVTARLVDEMWVAQVVKDQGTTTAHIRESIAVLAGAAAAAAASRSPASGTSSTTAIAAATATVPAVRRSA
ncbi:hypothetical protein AMAG_09353 [Allomyces macrogynus ATCC 38327]|uniref:TIP41-like protein n=2 Tax=Allomyces macrogynus (strain ATCC 38327) TaxID=578462 RepID=A0A0L0SPB3_ALLM3|nr:hypothetical protein AMAG_09353 [Allomyces macrogynus ATCC 38327]|eukprot:KNE64327.1 hypothetical protein AMAG_09353 [Allomyces macrogynus ATCC 38327]